MSIFDYDDGDIIISGGNIGFDSDGDIMMRMGDGLAMDMDTGELHIVALFIIWMIIKWAHFVIMEKKSLKFITISNPEISVITSKGLKNSILNND